MKIAFADPSLESLDTLTGDVLVLSAFADDRPLRGLAGRVDWRLCGRLSAWMQQDFLTLELFEVALSPMPRERLPFARILALGLGRRTEFDAARFDATCELLFARAAGIGALDIAMAMPGRIGMQVGLRQAVHGWGHAIAKAYDAERLLDLQVTMLEPLDFQRELSEPLREMARRLHERAVEVSGHVEAPEESETPAPDPSPRDWRTGMRRLTPVVSDGGPLGDL